MDSMVNTTRRGAGACSIRALICSACICHVLMFPLMTHMLVTQMSDEGRRL